MWSLVTTKLCTNLLKCLRLVGPITILEAASAIGEAGAGVQVSPNISHLLIHWGLGPSLEELGVKIQALSFKRWSNDEVIGWMPFGDVINKEYGSPFYYPLWSLRDPPLLHVANGTHKNITRAAKAYKSTRQTLKDRSNGLHMSVKDYSISREILNPHPYFTQQYPP
ncbi:hypothetical protein BD769DRAFT_1646863 [Suillus cothurnatus]|nr:hypothetical protein BD769DRAFT_1646863 [Suillus cothurnatus]